MNNIIIIIKTYIINIHFYELIIATHYVIKGENGWTNLFIFVAY